MEFFEDAVMIKVSIYFMISYGVNIFLILFEKFPRKLFEVSFVQNHKKSIKILLHVLSFNIFHMNRMNTFFSLNNRFLKEKYLNCFTLN